MKQVHNNEKSYSCTHCGKGFFRRDWQIDHEIRKHSSKRKAKVIQIKYFCKYCNKAFRRKGNLIRHENSQVHPRARLIHWRSLSEHFALCSLSSQSHWKYVQTEEKPSSCQFCTTAFSINFNLNSHVKQVHTNEKPYLWKIIF